MNDLYILPHETWVIAREAQPCPVCASMSFIFVNRDGDSACVGCADQLSRDESAALMPERSRRIEDKKGGR